MTNPKTQFINRLNESWKSGTFVKLTLGHPAVADSPLRKLLFRPVIIKGETRWSVVSRFVTRDETKNITGAEAISLVDFKLGTEFLSANLFTQTEDVQLELGKKPRLRSVPVNREAATLTHDRDKDAWIDPTAEYLAALGVTDSRGKVRERMGDKYRQIERFVDLLASAFRESSLTKRSLDVPITFCDMGSGKGYLTFAAVDYFARIEKRAVNATGVEARADLVTLCNKVATGCGFDGLRFEQNTIEVCSLPEKLDVLVALHACNTATDDALASGIRAGAEIILAAPCCHKEIRPQMVLESPLRDVLRHGIFAERHAEMATDALRALILEREGYRVRVTEFVAAEHTAKNVMLIATRRAEAALNRAAQLEIDERIAALKKFYGIQHHRLEQLLVGKR